MLFISSSYIGQHEGKIYNGFFDCRIDHSEPVTDEDFERIRSILEMKTIEFSGLSMVKSTILFYRVIK